MTIKIPVHSFIDLITNSSSETFVNASGQTVEAVYELIEALFNQAAHPGLKAKDFFVVTLDGEGSSCNSGITNIEITAKDSSDPKQVAVVAALKKLFNSIDANSEYNG